MQIIMVKPLDKKAYELAKKTIPPKPLFNIITEVFKALADPTRLKILYALRKKSLSVRDLALIAGISESATSHQMSYLKRKKLVQAVRDGTVMYYSLRFKHISAFLKEAEFYADHAKHNEPDHPYDQA